MSRTAISTAASGAVNTVAVEPELGVRVHLRNVETLDDLADVTAPGPVEPGDLLAGADDLYRPYLSGTEQ
jgi:hypothetical protein